MLSSLSQRSLLTIVSMIGNGSKEVMVGNSRCNHTMSIMRVLKSLFMKWNLSSPDSPNSAARSEETIFLAH